MPRTMILGLKELVKHGQHTDLATGTNTNVAAGFDGGGFGFPIIATYTIGVSAAGNELGGLISSNKTTGDRWGLISRNDNGSGAIGAEARLAGFSTVPQATGMPNGGGGSPEILFEDYGVGQLSNGEVTIKIDPIFAKNIVVNEKHPLKVFIQLEGDCKGVYVTEKSKDSFTVKELGNGSSNIQFSWHIVANRIDDKDDSGNVYSKHEGVRFPYGPKKLEPLKYGKAKTAKRK